METTTAQADVALEGATLIAGVLEGLLAAPGSEAALSQVASETLIAAGFEGKQGQTISLQHDVAAALVLVGLGEDASFETLRSASGNAIRQVKTERAVSLLAGADVDGATRAVVEGSILGGYEYRNYKTDDDALKVETIEIVGADADMHADAVVLAEATLLARDWVNTPAKDKAPQVLADSFASFAREAGVNAEIWDLARISDEGLGALLGVAAGSDRDPRVVVLEYTPEDAETHLAMVGKGITFDSGGLSIKPSASMEEMKDDMAGAAAVVAATVGIARLGLPVRVTTITPLTDNVIGGDATRPGDVLRPVEGPTIEVLNTDAEGRLILADGLGLAKRRLSPGPPQLRWARRWRPCSAPIPTSHRRCCAPPRRRGRSSGRCPCSRGIEAHSTPISQISRTSRGAATEEPSWLRCSSPSTQVTALGRISTSPGRHAAARPPVKS